MSKAEAWRHDYQRVRATKPAPFRDPQSFRDGRADPYIHADIEEHGLLYLTVNGQWVASLTPDTALALAAWIADIFGETP